MNGDVNVLEDIEEMSLTSPQEEYKTLLSVKTKPVAAAAPPVVIVDAVADVDEESSRGQHEETPMKRVKECWSKYSS